MKDGYLKNPHVMVSIQEHKSEKVFVLGEVGGYGRSREPGTYYLKAHTSITKVISWEGGPSEKAGNEIYVIRPSQGEKNRGSPRPLVRPESRKSLFSTCKKCGKGT